MKRNILWLLGALLFMGGIVLTFTGPAVAAKEKAAAKAQDLVKLKLTKLDGSVVEKSVEKPRYGGEFRMGVQSTTGPLFFDDAFGHVAYAPTTGLTHECLLQGDWATGLEGTGEVTWRYEYTPEPEHITGCLAESWEMPDPNSFLFRIRRGIHFHDKPPVNGRQITARDVAYSLKRLWEKCPKSIQYTTQAPKTTFPDVDGAGVVHSIYAPDDWTVMVKLLPGNSGLFWEVGSLQALIIPHEVVEKDGTINKWESACGTGPFVLTNYVHASSATLQKNPNYWMKNPLHPGDTLPYLDSVKMLFIGDPGTIQAALRTAKIDTISGYTGIVSEDADKLKETNPDLKWARFLGTPQAIKWRVDKPDLPWHDITVRRALCMAVDDEAIRKEFYRGDADLAAFPAGSITELKDIHWPLETLPPTTQKLYQYHPEAAKKLLTEAGYPDGFKCEVICTSAHVDLLSIVKEYWQKNIGVDMNIVVKESGVFSSIFYGKSHGQMIAEYARTRIPFRFCEFAKGLQWNAGMIDDPLINEAYQKVNANYFNTAEKRRVMREIIPHLLDQAYLLQFPTTYTYRPWQPWVKGYNGEWIVGYYGTNYGYPKYIWVDQDLKKAMMGKG